MSEVPLFPSRVLMTADTVGGVWTYALELARVLSGCGIEVALATMGAPLSRAQQIDARSIRRLHIYASDFRLEWMDDPWDDVRRAGDWLLRLEEHFRPEVVHLNGYAHGALPWKTPVLMVGHSCVLSWWQAVKGEPAPSGWVRYREAVSRGLQAARLVVTPSRSMLEALEHHYGPLPRTRVIPNGRLAALFPPATMREPAVMAAGRLWDEAKNISALSRVAPRLPWPVYVAGETVNPANGSELRHDVRLLGRLSPPMLARWLGRVSLYALPARYEPFGLSVLEAALAGCALVLGDIPSLREVWGEAALYVPPGDDTALEQGLRSLIADSARRLALAALARRRALELSPARMAASYLHAYRSMGEEYADHRDAREGATATPIEPGAGQALT